ncbi:MAG: PfkB family carbohydrate kinase [Bifidobacterium sp.]|jgi:sugar/nucleoside kinase (ribokinase family)|nr:PfkB family carbohydrate kinase [Bifidobacterium sp.]MCI1865547.1 PfkB family carbohydrate kinase [Bifidobacterium sp.]
MDDITRTDPAPATEANGASVSGRSGEADARSRAVRDTGPSVLSLGQIWVDIMLDVPAIPQAGGFAVTRQVTPAIGGSYRVLDAARRMGARSRHGGIIGTGFWGTAIRNALQESGIEHVGQDRLDADTGFRLVFNDGERKTFIATYGAETQGDEETFAELEPDAGDVVHISGNTLMDHSAAGIDVFLERKGNAPGSRDFTLVLNPTNSLHLVNDHLLEDTVLARPLWSCNRQEAVTLAERLGVDTRNDAAMTVGGGFDESMAGLCEALGSVLHAPIVLRAGSRGAWVREANAAHALHIPGYPTKPVHTRSAGSCHTGALCAMLAEGRSLQEATRLANAAASLAIDHSVSGVPQCPDPTQAQALADSSGDMPDERR